MSLVDLFHELAFHTATFMDERAARPDTSTDLGRDRFESDPNEPRRLVPIRHPVHVPAGACATRCIRAEDPNTVRSACVSMNRSR